MYFSKKNLVMICHHVGDCRITGPPQAQRNIVAHLAQYMLLKLSEPVTEGLAYKYLGTVKIRIPNGWVTVPDPRHVLGVEASLGLDGLKTAAATPGVPRVKAVAEEPDGQYGSPTDYRSAVRSPIHATKDTEIIAFPTKELSRKLSDPQQEDWQDLVRLVRFLHGKETWGTKQTVQQTCEE